MVKRHYIQDYSENFRRNTETRTVASDFSRPSIESSLTRREKKRTYQEDTLGKTLSRLSEIAAKYRVEFFYFRVFN